MSVRSIALLALLCVAPIEMPANGYAKDDPENEKALIAADMALKTCEYTRGLADIEALAKRGDVSAQVQLSMAYKQGLAGATHIAEAPQWMHMAFDSKTREAEQGDADAMFWLSSAYRQGWSVEANNSLATAWKDKALSRRVELATVGDSEAQFQLAWYFTYLAGEKEKGRGQKWWDAARPKIKERAESGDLRAQRRLADIYEFGQGVSKDQSEAKRWYTAALAGLDKAAEAGDVKAMLDVYSIVFFDNAGLSTHATAKRWYNEVLRRYQAAASRGCVPAQAWLANQLDLKWSFAPLDRPPERVLKLQSLMWWTIVASSSDARYRELIEEAQKEKSGARLSILEQELVSNKAARCVQTNYRICE